MKKKEQDLVLMAVMLIIPYYEFFSLFITVKSFSEARAECLVVWHRQPFTSITMVKGHKVLRWQYPCRMNNIHA